MLEDHKSDFRKSCIKRLKFKSRFSKVNTNYIVINKLYKLINSLGCKNILLYLPLKMEVNIMPLIKRLRKEKKVQIYVPYMIGDSFKAVKFRLPLKIKKFGIKEPNNSYLKNKIDLAIVPVVGIDALYKRIGFGKGMYDRYFYRLKHKPIIVFTQLTYCKSSKVLSNHYDIQADYIVTN
ncbi:MAG: 5-formyltetrahydrofolate cyclo-ligase [Campylobacteraceae bacterium]|nr:5-formyltetrahydrofolate cyclo-ligase [Campylobacteraceae bacterium]